MFLRPPRCLCFISSCSCSHRFAKRTVSCMVQVGHGLRLFTDSFIFPSCRSSPTVYIIWTVFPCFLSCSLLFPCMHCASGLLISPARRCLIDILFLIFSLPLPSLFSVLLLDFSSSFPLLHTHVVSLFLFSCFLVSLSRVSCWFCREAQFVVL